METEQLARNLKHAVDSAAARHQLSPDGWLTIERRLRREPWRRAGTAVLAAVIVAALAITVSHAGFRSAKRGAAHPGLAHLGQLAVLGETRLRGAGLSMAAGFGAVWVPAVNVTYEVDQANGQIARTVSTPGTFPSGCGSGVAAGAGSVWVSYGCRGLYRIDPRTGKITAAVRVGQAGDTLAVADGLVWVPTYAGNLLRIDPRTGSVVGKPIKVGYGDWMIVPGAGALWVTSFGSGTGLVSQVNPVTGAVTEIPQLADVAAVGSGSLWTSQVQRVNPATGKTIASVSLPTQGFADVAFWKGQVWILTLQRSLDVVRIDPAVNNTVGPATPIPVSVLAGSTSEPASLLAAGPAGLWVIDYSSGALFHLGIKGHAPTFTLPPVDAPGFPGQVYPPPGGHNVLNLVGQCPNPSGLQAPGPGMGATALAVVNSLGRSFRSDLHLSDRVYWQQTLIDWRGGYAKPSGQVSAKSPRAVRVLYSGPLDSYHQAFGPPDLSHVIQTGCGALTAKDTWMIVEGPPNSPGIQGEYLLLDRQGHVLVWNAQ